MLLTRDVLKKLLHAVARTRPDEIDCATCFESLDAFAEMKLEGRSVEEAMPLLQHHLAQCPCCREEFELLLEALRAAQRDVS